MANANNDANNEVRRLDNDPSILRRRTERLMALRYDSGRATVLACSAIDIHELERLIARGCPPLTAARIAA